MPTISLRLNDQDQAALQHIISTTGALSASAAIRELIHDWQPPIQPVPELEVVVSADRLRAMRGAKQDVWPLLHETAKRFRQHVKRHGWPMADIPAPLSEVLADLQTGGQRLASSYLRAVFPSFWHADDGPAILAQREGVLEKVLEYRMGFNATGEVFDIDWAEIRRAFIVQRRTVSFFQPSLAYRLYERFCPQGGNTWDPSGGFGARMLGFASARPEGAYFANEPAMMTSVDLERLSASLNHLGRRTQVSRLGSEHGHPSIQPGTIDCVFTSPPYFGVENYFDESSQAGKHETLTAWTEKYLRPTLAHAIRYLKPEGLLVLNTDKSEPYLTVAAEVGFSLENDEALPVKRDHYTKRQTGKGVGHERLLIWRKR